MSSIGLSEIVRYALNPNHFLPLTYDTIIVNNQEYDKIKNMLLNVFSNDFSNFWSIIRSIKDANYIEDLLRSNIPRGYFENISYNSYNSFYTNAGFFGVEPAPSLFTRKMVKSSWFPAQNNTNNQLSKY